MMLPNVESVLTFLLAVFFVKTRKGGMMTLKEEDYMHRACKKRLKEADDRN